MSEQLQQTDEWFKARIGKVTASRISDVLAGGKGITRKRYASQLASERMTGKMHRQSFRSFSMEHGNEFEPVARMAYEIVSGNTVEQVGFIDHPLIPWAGASPDGLLNADGVLEIKCPETHTFFDYASTMEIPRDYQLQMLWQIACTRRKFADFVAYDPDMPDEQNLLVIRYEPTRSAIEDVEREIIRFNAEVSVMIADYKKLWLPTSTTMH